MSKSDRSIRELIAQARMTTYRGHNNSAKENRRKATRAGWISGWIRRAEPSCKGKMK